MPDTAASICTRVGKSYWQQIKYSHAQSFWIFQRPLTLCLTKDYPCRDVSESAITDRSLGMVPTPPSQCSCNCEYLAWLQEFVTQALLFLSSTQELYLIYRPVGQYSMESLYLCCSCLKILVYVGCCVHLQPYSSQDVIHIMGFSINKAYTPTEDWNCHTTT